MGDLGLNEHHQNIVLGYMRFSRHARSQKLRSIDLNFDDLKLSRLSVEDTFTSDEVSEMLDGVKAVVKADVETELINSSHTNILLLRQLFSQAEKWHLKLQADISELENQELLDAIKSFEEHEKDGTLSGEPSAGGLSKHKLEPMHDAGTSNLLQQEIDRVNAENEKLKNRLKMVEGQAQKILEDKSKLSENLRQTQGELSEIKNKKPEITADDVSTIKQQLDSVKMEMNKTNEQASVDRHQLSDDLTSTKHRLLEVQEQLELAEKELDKKFQQTGAYKNLKQMLAKKNEQIKDLRKELVRYKPVDDVAITD